MLWGGRGKCHGIGEWKCSKRLNPEFNLENLRNFSSNTFVHLRYPGDWISDTAGTIGNKGLDRLKAHCEIREFLKYEADKFDSSHNFFAMKQEVKENLEGINQQISSAKLENHTQSRKWQLHGAV